MLGCLTGGLLLYFRSHEIGISFATGSCVPVWIIGLLGALRRRSRCIRWRSVCTHRGLIRNAAILLTGVHVRYWWVQRQTSCNGYRASC